MPRKRPIKSTLFATIMAKLNEHQRQNRAVASLSGIPRETVRRWADGKEPHQIAVLEAIASALGLEIIVRGAKKDA